MSKVFVNYDIALENDIAAGLPAEQSNELLAWVGLLRGRIADCRIRRIASTRLVVGAAMALKAGRTIDQVKARFFQDWTADERAKVGA